MSDRLYSPQMRKWMRDARRHGLDLGFERTGKRHEDGAMGGYAATYRLTDDFGFRIIDNRDGKFGNTAVARHIDHAL